MEMSWQGKSIRCRSSPVKGMEPFSTQRITGTSVQPTKSALILSATLSMASMMRSWRIKGLNVLSRIWILSSFMMRCIFDCPNLRK